MNYIFYIYILLHKGYYLWDGSVRVLFTDLFFYKESGFSIVKEFVDFFFILGQVFMAGVELL